MKQQQYVGLTEEEVLESRQRFGRNVFTEPERTPLWRRFLEKFSDPLIVILLVAGVLSVAISFYEFFSLHEEMAVFSNLWVSLLPSFWQREWLSSLR